MNFRERLIEKIKQKKSIVCVGLDPDTDSAEFPSFIKENYSEAKWVFSKMIIDEVEDLVAVVKPNTRFFMPNEFLQLKEIVRYAHSKDLEVIADCKQNDIGSTMGLAYKYEFDGFDFDAITVNGYLGSEGVIGDKKNPIFEKWFKKGKGIFVLVKTSNPSSSEIQNLTVGISDPVFKDDKIYHNMAKLVEKWSSEYEYTIGAVVGATSQQIAELRDILSGVLLMPGYGARGATGVDIKDCVKDGKYAIVNSSRAIMYAYTQRFKGKYTKEDFAKASRKEVLYMDDDINTHIKLC